MSARVFPKKRKKTMRVLLMLTALLLCGGGLMKPELGADGYPNTAVRASMERRTRNDQPS
jgi:hypothetical protein